MNGAVNWSTWATRAVNTLGMAPDVTDEAWVALFAPGGTYQDPMTGRTSDVVSVFAITRSTFADWQMTVTNASGDVHGGAIEWVSHGHLPQGPSVTLHGCSLIHLAEDRRVIRWRDYFDMGEFDRQVSPREG